TDQSGAVAEVVGHVGGQEGQQHVEAQGDPELVDHQQSRRPREHPESACSHEFSSSPHTSQRSAAPFLRGQGSVTASYLLHSSAAAAAGSSTSTGSAAPLPCNPLRQQKSSS